MVCIYLTPCFNFGYDANKYYKSVVTETYWLTNLDPPQIQHVHRICS